jgi:hypothetical protein
MLNQYLRNTGVRASDPNYSGIVADFNQSLGNRYQIVLAKMVDYKTETYNASFNTGLNAILLSTGVSQAITSIASSGTTATVTLTSHGYSNGNSIAISGASVAGFNGTFTIGGVTTNTFTYTLAASLSGATATPTQYFPLPAGQVSIEAVYITIGTLKYPLKQLNDENKWNEINAIPFQPTTYPQYYLPRRDDFGVWPIPQTSYPGSISYHYRDRNLSVADYATGTVTVTNNSTQITGSGTTFTAAMVGRWFTVTDTTVGGQGYWYRVGSYTSGTVINLDKAWSGTTSSGAAYNIGETPELPEEGHMVLVYGATADFYSNLKNDETTAAKWENRFWTGDPNNTNRKFGDNDVIGGVIGLVNKYTDRNESHVIQRNISIGYPGLKAFGITLSGS